MTLYQPEPVEISTKMRRGEWTEASLEELVTLYRSRLMEMGAGAAEVVTEVERDDDGSVQVEVSWIRRPSADVPAAGQQRGGTQA